VRVEGGSYGFVRSQVSSGGVEGPLDHYVSVMGRYRDGFREHSRENTELLFSDVGYKISENVENRVYLTLDRTDRQKPGGLSKEDMKENPKQADPDAVEQDFNKAWSYIRIADKITVRTDGNEFEAGLYWWHRDLQDRDFFESDFRQGIQNYYSDNFGIVL